jgi:hypothetical protein
MAASKRLGLGPECAIRPLGQPMLTVPAMVSTMPTPGQVAVHRCAFAVCADRAGRCSQRLNWGISEL